MTNSTLKVNPQIMTWARDERGYSLEDAASKLSKPVEKLKEWESSGEPITFSELKTVANTYKRQISVFFLKEVPNKTKLPEDRRNLSVDEKSLSVETRLAVRRTSRYLKVARELQDTETLSQEYEWIKAVHKTGSIEQSAKAVRELLKVSTGAQQKLGGSDLALKFWRDRIEDYLGIYTFNLLMPFDELDGFSYVEDGIPYGITLNSRHTKNRNIYTLFHELGHILEGGSGICFISETSGVNDGPERRCDKFAAELLMPKEAMQKPKDYQELREYAKKLCVSTEAYARRLYALDTITLDVRDDFIKQIKSTPLPRPEKKEIKIPPVVMSKSRHGESFFNLVIEAHGGGRLSSSQAADILNLRPTAIDRL